MKQIFTFMKSTKGIILMCIFCIGLTVVAFTKNDKSEGSHPKQKLLTTVVEMLENQHYAPKKIDDNFSKTIFKKIFDELDPDRVLFTQKDINSLSKFETILDDEMHGKEIEFMPALNAIYNKRIDEIIAKQKEILSKPFNYSVDETYEIDGDKVEFTKTDEEKNERLRKKLKYMSLERYIDLMNEREKSSIDSIKQKSDTQLEFEARQKTQKALDKIYNRIKAKFNEDERFNTYINIITTQMDPHTDYFPPVEKRAFDEQMSGKFFGIGAQLQEVDGVVKIAALMPNYPAQRSGEIVVGDIIQKVAQGGSDEYVDITGYEIGDAVKLIRGKKDTEVKLIIKKQDGTTKQVNITRAEIVQDESFTRSAVITQHDGSKIGYIYLPDFYADFNDRDGSSCSNDVARELVKLKEAGVKGITLDLRYNGGGSLQEVVNMVGLFIPKGPVVQVKDKVGNVYALDDKNDGVLYSGPLVVMVNELSASASEIFAAAIQDYGRGIIVGSSSTYGKGTVQRQAMLGGNFQFFNREQMPSNDMGSLKITFQKFYRINGGSTQLKGVVPDVIIPDPLDYLKIREKDVNTSLAWDEIAKAKYTPSKEMNLLSSVIKKSNDEINSNATFNLIKQNTTWLSKKGEEARSLEINKYKAYQKEVSSTVTQNTNVLKLKNEMNIDVTKQDHDKYYNNVDKAKGERYQAWLKNLKTDLYLSETINIVKHLINTESLALSPSQAN